MTVREIFAAWGRGWWIITAVVIVAVAVGYLALTRIEPTYTASGTVRANPFLSEATLAGQISGVPVDVDPSLIPTETVLDPAAASLGIGTAALRGAVTYQVVSDGSTSSVTVTATSSTAAEAQRYAQAVLTAYTDYVTTTIAGVVTTLQASVTDATAQVQALQAQLAADPNDPVVAQNLGAALATLSTQTARVADVQNAGNFLTVVQPVGPGVSATPGAVTILALALLCGLLAGAGLVLLLDRFDDRLRSAEDVEELIGAPLLAELPYDRAIARPRRGERLPAASGRRTILAERLRSLRTSIQVLLPDGKGVVVLTSVEPGDGKTFVSSNLAVAWARAGRKVILVGGDMRRPEIDQYFTDLGDGPGLSDLLALRVDGRRSPTQPQIEETLVSTTFRGLRVLPPGTETDDSADLLGGSNLPRILGFASRIADVVVVDSPPALGLADASELAASADGVVVLATVGRTRRRLLRDAVDTLRANDLPVLGVVVNRSRRRLPKTYSAYYVTPDRRRSRDRGGKSKSKPAPLIPVADTTPELVDAGLLGRDRRQAAMEDDD